MYLSSIRRAAPALALIAVCFAIASCGFEPEEDLPVPSSSGESIPLMAAGGRIRLTSGFGSVDALAREALNALASADTMMLLRLLVSREEFDRYLYPELGMHYPAARDTSAPAREFIWESHSLGALKGMKKALRELGGKRMALIAVTFREGAESYGTYRIHTGTEVKVRLENGSEIDLPVLGSVVEMDGIFKLLSYSE